MLDHVIPNMLLRADDPRFLQVCRAQDRLQQSRFRTTTILMPQVDLLFLREPCRIACLLARLPTKNGIRFS